MQTLTAAHAYYVLTAGRRSTPIPIVPIPRPPLTAWPTCASCPGPYTYYNALPWEGGVAPHIRDYLRMDAWGMEIAGLPVVPGASSEPNRSRDRVLTYFLDRWSPDWQRRILTQYAGYGYTHLLLSVADSCGADPCPFGPGPPGAQRTLAQFTETCALVKAYVPYLVVALGGKNFQPKDQSPQQWADYAGPIFEACDGLVDEWMSPWEWNLWNVPGQWTIDSFKAFGRAAHAQGASFWLHFSCHYTSWQADGSDRFEFWRELGTDVDGVMYQAYPVTLGWPWPPVPHEPGQRWDVGEMQARMCDTLWQFGDEGNIHKLRAFELTAIDQFTNEHPTEDEANTVGYLACCMFDDVKHTGAVVYGSGNGARMPDGSPV